jgi:hypothetical protein
MYVKPDCSHLQKRPEMEKRRSNRLAGSAELADNDVKDDVFYRGAEFNPIPKKPRVT